MPRSSAFRANPHKRFWWHHTDGTDYVPSIYQVLTDDEWEIMEQWYARTEADDSIGEINVPAMGMIQGLISGSGLSRVVQLGHYYGYSALLIGFWLRAMGGDRKLISIDIDPKATAFTQEWIDKAGLGGHVDLMLEDSADSRALRDSTANFNGMGAQLIVLDSSHQYEHTMRELDLWVPAMASQAIMFLHDTSTYAKGFDSTGKGGVQKALDDWTKGRKDVAVMNLNRRVGEDGVPGGLTYLDGCGLGVLQKL